MPRSTVSIDRDVLRRVDAWAIEHGYPEGPGHRAKAVQALVEAALGAA